MKINQRCRVYGRFLTEGRERRGKWSAESFIDNIYYLWQTQSVQLTQAMT